MLTVLLTLIFIRPFISSLAFPYLNSLYCSLLLCFIVLWFLFKRPALGKFRKLRYPLIIFSLSLAISVLFSQERLGGLAESCNYTGGLSLFVIAAALSWNEKIRVIRTLILAGFVVSLLAVYQALFGFGHILDYVAQKEISDPFVLDYISRRRVFLPFVTPNILADYLIMVIPLSLINKKSAWSAAALFAALLLTKSIGALLSLYVALGIYFSLQERFKKRNLLLLAGILTIAVLVLFARSGARQQHLQPAFSTLMRLNYWKDTFEIIKSSPLSGVGIGNFNLMRSRYAHNSYLQIWAEMGLPAIASILWLIIAVFKSAFKHVKDSPYRREIGGLIAAGIAFLIHNLVDFGFFLPEVSLTWWLILGLLYGAFH